MEKTLTDILREALIGKKIKLYKVLDKKNNENVLEYFITERSNLFHPKKCKIIGESIGVIKSIDTEHDTYDGDFYDVKIVDENNNNIHFNGLNTITSKFEIID